MKNKGILLILGFAAVAIAVILSGFRQTQVVKAQDQVPPPTNDRVSFGMVGITSGQTLRVSVANTIMPNDPNLPPGPSRVAMMFRYANGNLARNARTGEVIRKVVDLERGDSVFLDLNYDELPPGPVRVQLRAVVVVVPPPTGDNNTLQDGVCVPSLEVINNANGRTQFVVSNPGVIRGFNPQPDPPAEP